VFAGVGNATHFHTTGVSPAWRHSLVPVGQVGDHLFYRFGGRSGSREAFSYAARPSSEADSPRLIQASLDPTGPVREAGAVAYNMLVAQDRGADADAPAPAPAPPAPVVVATAPASTADASVQTTPTA
jgi:hypothetical protein